VGKKRLKIAKGVGSFIPISMNFSALERDVKSGELAFDPSDGGLEKKRLQSNLQYEEMIIQILSNLEKREKLVFIFQLLRDGGYQIDHGSFAKVVNLSRRQYMRVLDTVRIKSALYVAGYISYKKSHKESK
jgi:c-di-GMP-related signal transduction protein